VHDKANSVREEVSARLFELGARLCEIRTRGVQQLLPLALLQQQRELMFFGQRLLKARSFGCVLRQKALMIGFTLVKNGRQTLPLGERLIELGSNAVQQLPALGLLRRRSLRERLSLELFL
jgi:hypothetical protein